MYNSYANNENVLRKLLQYLLPKNDHFISTKLHIDNFVYSNILSFLLVKLKKKQRKKFYLDLKIYEIIRSSVKSKIDFNKWQIDLF